MPTKKLSSLRGGEADAAIQKNGTLGTGSPRFARDDVEVKNFGCRLNVYEGEVIKQQAGLAGLEDAIVFNSCAVTSEAERQVRQAIRKAAKEHPGKKLIVTGCSAQINPQQYLDMPEVAAVLGNEDKLHKESYARLFLPTPLVDSSSSPTPLAGGDQGGGYSGNSVNGDSPPPAPPASGVGGSTAAASEWGIIRDDERAIVNDIMSIRETAGHLVSSIDGHSRAFVQVQNGCDHRCTFCIIPYGRGNSRSVPAGEIVQQVRMLVEQGYKEVVLTGVDVSDYGNGLPGDIRLGELCKKILKLVPDLPRLRISSIDAVEVDDTLLDVIANESRLMPHMHLSLQAGNDMVLKRMKRRHLRADIVDFCNKVRALRPDMVYGADIIAGFPTETDEMFADTLNLVEEVGLTYLHVFPYSAREGTPAAKMPQVKKEIRKTRAAQLREAGERQQRKLFEAIVGTNQQVLMERGGIGHTPTFVPVRIENLPPGSLVQVEITREMIM